MPHREDSIDKCLSVIERIGYAQDDDAVAVTFGKLFMTYQNVSDALVGILARAKKRGLLIYQGASGGDILLQGRHDLVVITMSKSKVRACFTFAK